MSKVEIIDLTKISSSFPPKNENEIFRNHLITTIDTLFEEEYRVVVIRGLDGIGKTTLLSQFARKYPDQSISLFIQPANRMAYRTEPILIELCNQIYFALNGVELSVEQLDQINESYLRKLSTYLQRQARIKRTEYYFIVDGLMDIPEHERQEREKIIEDLLPFAFQNFRFLISGDLEKLSLSNIQSKEFPTLTPFTLDETKRYFSDIEISDVDLDEIHRVCRGVPGHFSALRRLLGKNFDIEQILNEMPSKLPSLFEYEWQNVNLEDEVLQQFLAIIAHPSKRYRIDDLARILSLSSDDVIELVRQVGFLSVDKDSKSVSYISELHRKFAEQKLYHIREKAYDLIIQDLRENPQGSDAFEIIPTMLESLERYDEVISYLSPDVFSKILKSSQSLHLLKTKAHQGVIIADKIGQDNELIRFGLNKSIIASLEGTSIWQSEIEALLSLNNYDAAISLAQSATLAHERLLLLSTVAKYKIQQGDGLDEELKEQIQILYKKIDPSELGENVFDIASELMYIFPELAIELVERNIEAKGGSLENDVAFIKLSSAASNVETEQGSDVIEVIRKRIKDPKFRHLSTTLALMLGEYSSTEAIAKTKEIEGESEKIYFLRQWAMENREDENAIDVVEYAMRSILKFSSYSVNAKDLREIATPLQFSSKTKQVKLLVDLFDVQKHTVREIGPTEDYVRLQLILAKTELQYDVELMKNRLLEIYIDDVSDIENQTTKAVCLARISNSLCDLDENNSLENEYSLTSIVQNELDALVEKLLQDTGYHFSVTKGIIRALARRESEKAFQIIQKINTELRRNQSILYLVQSILDSPIEEIDFKFLCKAINTITSPRVKDSVILKTIGRIHVEKGNQLPNHIMSVFGLLDTLSEAKTLCNASALAYDYLSGIDDDEYLGLRKKVLSLLSNSWEAIDTEWDRVDFGFKSSEVLASSSINEGQKFLELTEDFRKQISLFSDVTTHAFIFAVRLVLRSYKGLLPENLVSKNDYYRIEGLINKISSNGYRALLWSEFATYHFQYERSDTGRKIVFEKIKPLLDSIPDIDKSYYGSIIALIAPVLYLAHKKTAVEAVLNLHPDEKTVAISNISRYLLTKTIITEPYSSSKQYSKHYTTWEDLVDVCELINYLEQDSEIVRNIYLIAEILLAPGSKFSPQQKQDIADRLENIINSKLPDLRNINHEGYKIIAEAELFRIRRNPQHVWDEMYERAKDIPNKSDKVFTLSKLAFSLGSRSLNLRSELLSEIEEEIEKIPSSIDKAKRLESIAQLAIDNKQNNWAKKLLQVAMEISSKDPNFGNTSTCKRIIDHAYQIDEDYAETLASMLDDDPSRVIDSYELKDRVSYQKLATKLKNMHKDKATIEYNERKFLPSVAWKTLGSLNADHINTFHTKNIKHLIEIAADVRFEDAYPIYSLFVENAVKRFANTQNARDYLRPMFDAITLSTELAVNMINTVSMNIDTSKSLRLETYSGRSGIIRAGDREGILEFLRKWITENVSDYLKICDPYFGLEDLEILRFIQDLKPEIYIHVLTSIRHMKNKKVEDPWQITFQNYWKQNVSEQYPPDTELFVVGFENGGDLPIHERWWVTNGAGVTLGTSIKSLGEKRESEFFILSKNEALLREQEIDQYLNRKVREKQNKKINYTMFTL